MARDRLAAIRERRAQGLADPPSAPTPPQNTSSSSWDRGSWPADGIARPDPPQDFDPFARQRGQPTTPSPASSRRSSRRFSFHEAQTTGWFSGWGWGWGGGGAAQSIPSPQRQPSSPRPPAAPEQRSQAPPRQPFGGYSSRSLPPVQLEQLNYDDEDARYYPTERIAPSAIPEVDLPQDFNPNEASPATRRVSTSDWSESPRSSVVYSGNTMYPNGDAGARGTGAKHSGTEGAQREPSGATIVEESEDVEKVEEEPAEQSEPAPRQQLARRTADISSLQQEVRHAHGLIQTISSLRDRLLAIPSADSPIALEIREDLDRQTTAARGLFTSIQRRVRELEQGDANLRVLIPAGLSELSLQDVSVRQQQVGLVKGRFKEMIHRYAETEREHRAKQRARVERQLRVVSPNLPPEEMRDLVDRAEAGESTAIFAQAASKHRLQVARGALREVQNRAAELARIEQTLIELAQLFQDMAVIVEAQDVVIADIEQTAVGVSTDMEKGVEQVQTAVGHARNARKWRWLCCGITVLIAVILIVVLCATLIPPALRNKNGGPAGAAANAPTAATT
ncbi:hypothetical protein JCM8202_000830 [Rhodotorula sphaerocarpa]